MSSGLEIPKPMVQMPLHKGLPIKIRVGRGFSISELKATGLDVKKARKLGLRVDERRDTRHEANVNALKEFLKKAASSS